MLRSRRERPKADRSLALNAMLLAGLVAVLTWSLAQRAGAEALVEAWRSFPRWPNSVSVNGADGSCWVAATGGLVHVSSAGKILFQRQASGQCVSVNSADGSCWAACWAPGGGYAAHLSASGSELSRSTTIANPGVVAVNSADGSCWIGERRLDEGAAPEVIRVTTDGTERSRTGGFQAVSALSVCPADGTCWVSDADSGTVCRLAEDGTRLWSGSGFGSPVALSVDPDDGSCWVADSLNQQIIHLAASGAELWRSAKIGAPGAVCVNEADGSCYATANSQLLIFAADGTLLANAGPFGQHSISVNSTDGSCWIADYTADAVVEVSPALQEVWRSEVLGAVDVAADMTDGSCLAALRGDNTVLRIAYDGTVQQRFGVGAPGSLSLNPDDGSWWVAGSSRVEHRDGNGTHLGDASADRPVAVSVDPRDGTCWVAAAGSDEVLRVGPFWDEVLYRQGGWGGVSGVSCYAGDGSCWVGCAITDSGGNGSVHHISETGALLCSVEGLGEYLAIAVDQGNGSCWVSDDNQGSFVNLAPDGTQLIRVTNILGGCSDIEVDASDGTFWACGRFTVVVHVDADGTVLSSTGGFNSPDALSLDRERNCLWVADTSNGQVVRLRILPFSDVSGNDWSSRSIAACVANGIVSGYPDGGYHPEWPVTRDQMAVYIARAAAGGDDAVPAFGGAPAFADVPQGHWALDYVQYAVAQNVVTGYDDGLYHPEYEVTRDQMAVYVARAMVAPTGEAALADYNPSSPRDFPDVPDDFWAWRHVEYCVEQGVVQGYADGYYHPEWAVNRDQMAVYIAKAFELEP